MFPGFATPALNMTDVIETQLLINNKLVPASDNGSFELFSPHNGDLVAKGRPELGMLSNPDQITDKRCSRRGNPR